MCSIFTLNPGQMIDEDKLINVVANNMDGYGIVLVDPDTKKMDIRRGFNPEGTDPAEMRTILEDNKDVIRHVHVRNQTKGEKNMDNTHPFEVYSDNTRTVVLMHNGTIYEFSPSTTDTRSDTKIFAETFVGPLLSKFKGEYGFADYNDPLVFRILEKYIGANNRVLLVSNDLEPLRCGTWKTITNKDGSTFIASNDDYFNSIVRGPRKPPFLAQTQHQNYHQHQHQKSTIGPHGNAGSRDVSLPRGFSTSHRPEQVVVGRALAVVPEATTPREETIEKGEQALADLKSLNLRKKEDFVPSETFLGLLGAGRGMFADYGMDMIGWMQDEELALLLKGIPVSQLIEFIRCLIEGSSGLADDLDLAVQVIEDLKADNANLKAMAEAADFDNEVHNELEETLRTVRHDSNILKRENKKLAEDIIGLQTEITYLENTLDGIMCPSDKEKIMGKIRNAA